MTLVEGVGIAKDVVVSLAAAATAFAAWRGISKWRTELEGKASFDVARTLARATYRLRDNVRSCRAPLFMGFEFPYGYSPQSSSPEQRAEAWTHAFNGRWVSVQEALNEFSTAALEAEAVWGPQVRDATERLRLCIREVRAAQGAIVDNHAGGGADFESDKVFALKMRQALGTTDNATDAVSESIREAVLAIEEAIKPHLRRG